MKLQAVLPLVTYPDPNSDKVAVNAVAVARQLAASLHAVAVNVDIPPVSSALSRVLLDVPALAREAERLSHERGRHLLAAVEEQAGKAGIALTTEEMAAAPAMLGEGVARAARYFDFALIGWEGRNPGSRIIAEAVVFGSGRPTILMPDLGDFPVLDHVAIAWDGSRVAARAAADARPLLDKASKISVLTVQDEKPLAESGIGERFAERLRKIGLPAEAHGVSAKGHPIGVALQDHALKAGANLLVMGGYGHSRVRDFVLGGATQGVLDELRLPVLLSH
ncbi:MAG TPA: universal stress protein [Rhizobiaceae bacterium]|nr:universal stress protein [Rhizobiaceae bacterium]